MIYENVETYLNEEVRRPIKHYLKDVDKKTVRKVMGVVDYLCDKYRVLNGTTLWYEEMSDFEPNDFRGYMAFMRKHGYFQPVNYDKLECPFTKEELMFLLDDDVFEGEDE